jgi:CDGSH-type Zn-finger protein
MQNNNDKDIMLDTTKTHNKLMRLKSGSEEFCYHVQMVNSKPYCDGTHTNIGFKA